MRVLVTGVAGFIGFHVARRLLADGHSVVGHDGLTSYYDVELKRARLAQLADQPRFTFIEGRLEDREGLARAVAAAEAEIVIHLAAQAGVRYAMEAPDTYVQSNVVGTYNLLEVLKPAPPRHLIFASSSSVYGGNTGATSRETERTDFPLSLYAATKKAGEDMCHSYAHLFRIPTTALRFFTVYGPWGRPDMALFKFVRGILAGEPIDIYGEGRMRRDFTYVDDVVDAVVGLMLTPPQTAAVAADSLSPAAPFRTVNVAGGQPVGLMEFVAAIESALGQTAIKRMLPMQAGDVAETHAALDLLHALDGRRAPVPVAEGVRRFVEWYRAYHAT